MEAFIFVWIAGVIGKLSFLLAFIGTVTMSLTTIVYGVRYLNWADQGGYQKDPDLNKKPPFKFHFKLILAGFFSLLVASLLPSERTMYLAGAAWMGQKVVQSETSDKVVKILNVKLDEYLKEAEEKLKK